MKKDQITNLIDNLNELNPDFMKNYDNVVNLINRVIMKYITVTLSQKGITLDKIDTNGVEKAQQNLLQEYPEFEKIVHVILLGNPGNVTVLIQTIVDRYVDVTISKQGIKQDASLTVASDDYKGKRLIK